MSSTYPEAGADGVRSRQPDHDDSGQGVGGEAAQFAQRTRDQLVANAEEKKAAVTDALGVFADAVRKAGEELSRQDQTFAGKVAGQAADGLQSLTRNVAGKSPEAMLNSARELGRHNPTALLAGAVLAGLAIGRFARSSAPSENIENAPSAKVGDGAPERATPGSDLA